MPDSEANNRPGHVLVFGEVLFDNFPDGRSVLGGAPFNVAWSLQGFGRKPLLVSAVGDDTHGHAVRAQMLKWGMDCRALQVQPDHATGEVRVSIRGDEPSYEISENRAWDFIHDERLEAGGVLYHGLLALRSDVSHATLRAITERSSAMRFFDINLRPPHVDKNVLIEWIRDVDWLKLNIDELRTILKNPDITFDNCINHIDQLRHDFSIQNVVLTGGSKGAILRGRYGNASCMPAPEPHPLVDTVGAGDAFSAATIEGILQEKPAVEIVNAASRFAAKVCGLRGATTSSPDFYQTVFHA